MDEVLHALRVKGRATVGELAAALDLPADDIERRLRALEAEGTALERAAGRRPGWMLTSAGRDAHAQSTLDDVPADLRGQLVEPYRGFLRVNDRIKEVCTVWQTTGDAERRLDLLGELHELHSRAAPVLERAGAALPRFARYGQRLASALERAGEDPRFVVSPQVDSYHTVWFECHEDFLVTLGRSRHQEGSW
jgi:DNA-binding Lrp family transcriptional regulator